VTLTAGGSFSDKVNFIWSVADLLRGDFKPHEYGRVILPFVVVRRLDCVLSDTKRAVRTKAAQLEGRIDDPERVLCAVAGADFYNTSPLDFGGLTADAANILGNLQGYIGGFSPGARDVIDKFRFDEQIIRLAGAGLLYQVVAKFADINLHPDVVGEPEMGYIYEELIRRFSEQSNETAGEHFTPREVIRLMVDLLLSEDDRLLRDKGVVKTLFDPACGTGGMLAVAEDRMRELNPDGHLEVHGQELRQLGTRLVTGPFGTILAASEYIDNGVPIINPSHIDRFGSLKPDPSISLSPATAARLHRHTLRLDDLVIGRKGEVGRAALIGRAADGWICGSDSIAVRCDPTKLLPGFLALALSSNYYRQQLAAHSGAATLMNVNEPTLLSLQIPDVSVERQSAIRRTVESSLRHQREALRVLCSQIGLLRERRQALITAAVTGELEVA